MSWLRGEGVQGQKSWKHDFEITGDPKGLPSGSTFWSGIEAPDSIGYSLLSYHIKFQPDKSKNC